MEETKSRKQLAEECLRTAIIQLKTSSDYKKKRFAKIDDAIEMKLGKVKPKLRQQFNVPLPVLSGLVDTICADLDDAVQVKVKNNPGKNLKAVKGINESFNIAKKSLKSTARWDYKDRMSRKNAVDYGRGILKYFSAASPYSNTLEVIHPTLFHCQPKGGGLLERHLFCGDEGIIKTKKQLVDGAEKGIYDKEAIALLIERSEDKEYQEKISSTQQEQNKRFRALGLLPDEHNYVGETTFNLVDWVLTKYGERYYIQFDPWNRVWTRFEKLKDMASSDLFPYVSYATHEDDEDFWSTSILADILYPIAEPIVTMFNQELTNRQKRNLNAKLYDNEMIKNVSKLDEAQYRADTLISVDTKGGTRKLSDATQEFVTPPLTGTIELIGWLEEFTGKSTGIFQNLPQANGKKTNNLVYATIQQLSKRIDYRAHSYSECWGEIALRHIQGLKDNLTDKEAIEMLGVDTGYGFVKELKKLNLDKDDIEIISTKAQAQEDALRKQQKEKGMELLKDDLGINAEWKRRKILSDISGYEQDEIEDALDMRSAGVERDQLSQAEEAIKDLIKGTEPEVCWVATTIFMRKILDFAKAHQVTLGDKFPKFMEYIKAHEQIVMENMSQLAMKMKAYQPPAPPTAGGDKGAKPVQTVQKPATMGGGGPTPVMVNQQAQ